MNKLIFIFTAAAMGFTCFGAPLDKKNVAGDAQWLAHLDFENLKDTKMGAFLLGHFLLVFACGGGGPDHVGRSAEEKDEEERKQQ